MSKYKYSSIWLVGMCVCRYVYAFYSNAIYFCGYTTHETEVLHKYGATSLNCHKELYAIPYPL